jgi:hypothetical protein
MLKLISTTIRITAVVGLLVALPRIAAMHRNVLEFVNAGAAQGKGANPSLAGQMSDSQKGSPATSMRGWMRFLVGRSADALGVNAASSLPSMIAGSDADDAQAADSAAKKSPPGACMMFVDGRPQIYYPAAKPVKGR